MTETTAPKNTPVIKQVNAHMLESHVELYHPNGQHIKNVSWPNFASEVLKQVKLEDNSGKKTRLPFGTIFSQFNMNKATVVVYHPSHRHKYTLVRRDGRTQEFNIVLPNIVSQIGLAVRDKNYYIERAILFATNIEPDVLGSRYSRGFQFQNGNSDMRGGTFNIPLTNMYENGTICFGGNSLPPTILDTDLLPCTRPYEILTDSPGNHDLGIRGVRGGSEFAAKLSSDSYVNFFKYWETLDAFPYDNMQEF